MYKDKGEESDRTYIVDIRAMLFKKKSKSKSREVTNKLEILA